MPADGPPGEPPLDALTEQALAWLVKLHSGSETAQDWADYEDWKAANEAQQRASVRAEQLWQSLGAALLRRSNGKGKLLPLILLGVLALPALGFFGGLFGPPASYFAAYQAPRGERRSVVLGDGSRVDLDTATSFDFDVGDRQRTLTLYTGQVFVAVRADAGRPFVVRAAAGTVRALGTAFDVRRDGGTTKVIVAEHAVRVGLRGETVAATVDVAAGQQVEYSAEKIGVPRAAEVEALTAWRGGKIVFDDQPLNEVVAELSRYRRGMIVILDSELNRMPVTGVLATDDDDAFFDAIRTIAPVSVRKLPMLTLIERDTSRSERR